MNRELFTDVYLALYFSLILEILQENNWTKMLFHQNLGVNSHATYTLGIESNSYLVDHLLIELECIGNKNSLNNRMIC